MTQRFLFGFPAARDEDPPSSHAAADRMTKSGRRDAHARIVLALVTANPGSTSVELHRLAAGRLERHEVSRRLADLERLGRVVRGPSRLCTVKGTLMLTWDAVSASECHSGDPGRSGGIRETE